MALLDVTESLRIAFDSMRSNKLRSGLASLGVVIGISFVIIMGWVLSGLDKAMQDTFNIIGTDMIYVDKWDWAGGGHNWKEMQARKNITYEQAMEFMKRVSTAEVVFPTARKFGIKVKYQSDYFPGLSVEGTTPDYGRTPSGNMEDGRFFNEYENQSSANVCVLGHKIYETMFPNGGGIGQYIKIEGRYYQVIGKVTKQGTLLMDFVDDIIFIPINSFFGIFGKSNRNVTIGLKAGTQENLDNVRSEAEGLMRTIRNIQPGEKNDFSLNETKAFEAMIATFRAAVWGVGIGFTILSFVVGIIGIMNIMFVTVTERTKEIGIRKAIGAKKKSILIQFIIESAFLCFLGAIVSFIITSIIVFAAATFLPKAVPQLEFLSPVIPFNLLIIATIVSLIVGMLAGVIPARRAANMDPIDALRFE